MNMLQSIIRYLCLMYPHRGELSKARLTKMVYLADWKSAQRTGAQLTDIRWMFNHYGPYVEDVVEAARNDRYLRVVETANMYGTPKVIIQAVDDTPMPPLSDASIDVLDSVIRETAPLYFSNFITHVYNTYPVARADRYEYLDLAALAREQKTEGPPFPF